MQPKQLIICIKSMRYKNITKKSGNIKENIYFKQDMTLRIKKKVE